MGTAKALLPIGPGTFLSRILETLAGAGLSRVTVVTGVHHDAIAAEVADRVGDPVALVPSGVRVVRNTTPGADQVSSLRCGLDAIDAGGGPGVDAVLVALVDHPFVEASTVRALVDRFVSSRAPVVRPACRGRHGHPVIFARETFGALRSECRDGAKGVVRGFAGRSVSVTVEDEGIWTDVDTPEEYAAALARFAGAVPGGSHA